MQNVFFVGVGGVWGGNRTSVLFDGILDEHINRSALINNRLLNNYQSTINQLLFDYQSTIDYSTIDYCTQKEDNMPRKAVNSTDPGSTANNADFELENGTENSVGSTKNAKCKKSVKHAENSEILDGA